MTREDQIRDLAGRLAVAYIARYPLDERVPGDCLKIAREIVDAPIPPGPWELDPHGEWGRYYYGHHTDDDVLMAASVGDDGWCVYERWPDFECGPEDAPARGPETGAIGKQKADEALRALGILP